MSDGTRGVTPGVVVGVVDGLLVVGVVVGLEFGADGGSEDDPYVVRLRCCLDWGGKGSSDWPSPQLRICACVTVLCFLLSCFAIGSDLAL